MRTWSLLKILATSVFLIASLFLYKIYLSPAARIGNTNQNNSYLVRAGMPLSQALKIMGPPQEEHKGIGGEIVYMYSAHPFAADNIYMAVNSNNVIARINHGE